MGDVVWLGVALAICAASFGTIGKQLLACSGQPGSSKWLAFAGTFINVVVGPIIDAVSYMFAPTTVIAPFACLDVILNLITAPVTLAFQKERLTKQHVVGVLLVTAGSLCTSIFGSSNGGDDPSVDELAHQLTRIPSLIYFGCEVAIIALLSAFLQSGRLPKEVSGISMGVIAGMLMGNVFCMKCFMTVLQGSINGDPEAQKAWGTPTPYICAVVALGGSLVANVVLTKGLRRHKGVFMITIFEGSHITAACISGAIVMSELHDLTWTYFVLYWTGIGLIISGMLIINAAGMAAIAAERSSTESFLFEDVATDKLIYSRLSWRASYLVGGMFASSSPAAHVASCPHLDPAANPEIVDTRPPQRASTYA